MKLHPLSIPYRIFENGAALVGILVLGAITGTGGFDLGGMAGVVLLGIVLSATYEAAHYSRFEYRDTEDTFDIESGVLSRRDREIPYGRIQNVDISQNAVQRVLGIAEVRLETAGGNTTEARLRYVSAAEAGRLQELISRKKRGEADEAEPTAPVEEELFRLNDRELAVLGVTSADFRLLGLLSVLLSFVAPAFVRQVSPGAELLLVLGPLTAVGILVVLWVVSGVRAVLRYYDFRLTRREGELRYERGLLQRYSGTIPLEKIQTVTVEENVLARQLGYASVSIETAGYGPGSGAESVQSAVPIAKADRARSLARAVEPYPAVEFHRPPKRARTRYLARYSIGVAAVLAVFWGVDRVVWNVPRWYLAAGLFVLVPVAAHLKWVHLGYYVDDDHAVTRRGFWVRRTTIVPYYRVQTVVSSQSIFQRRRDLGTLTIDTASSGGPFGRGAVALDIDADSAGELRSFVFDRFQRALSERKGSPEAAGTAAVD